METQNDPCLSGFFIINKDVRRKAQVMCDNGKQICFLRICVFEACIGRVRITENVDQN